MLKTIIYGFLLSSLITLVACQRINITSDEQLVAMALRVPGYGGMFLDANNGNQFTVYLKGVVWGASLVTPNIVDSLIRQAFRKVYGSDVSRGGSITYIEGQYSTIPLYIWRLRANSLFSIPGVLSTDLDEAKNRVGIDVDKDILIPLVEERLVSLGIPLEAVIIAVRNPGVLL